MATLTQAASNAAVVGVGGMDELLPLVKQLIDPEQVTINNFVVHHHHRVVPSISSLSLLGISF